MCVVLCLVVFSLACVGLAEIENVGARNGGEMKGLSGTGARARKPRAHARCALGFEGEGHEPYEPPQSSREQLEPVTNYTYEGILTPDCVRSYFRIYVTREIPSRKFSYWHELNQQNQLVNADGNCDRTVGDEEVCIEEVPYTVLYGSVCGGTIIAPEWVLTAAHCGKYEYVVAGNTQLYSGKRYNICANFIHPLFLLPKKKKRHPLDYDFQLLLLEQPIPVTPKSVPIALGTDNDISPGKMVSASGWGKIDDQGARMEKTLRRVYVPVIAYEVCRSLLNYTEITPRMVCMGYMEGKKDSCQGDSGGPAAANGKLVGVVSWGIKCAKLNQPGVYASVPSVRPWIRSITALPL